MTAKKCRAARKTLHERWSGAAVDRGVLSEAEQHLEHCAACRQYACGKGFSQLLRQAFAAEAPEPSADFHAALRRGLAAIGPYERDGAVRELLPRLGLRLVPALAALVLVMAGAAGFALRPPAAAGSAGLDELVLFSDAQLSSTAVASVILPDEETL